jgi:hypothetical protein
MPAAQGALTAQGVVAIIAMLAGAAWVKSAFLQLGVKPRQRSRMDETLNRISTNPAVWNAIAAGLSAAAAAAQGIAYILEAPPLHH